MWAFPCLKRERIPHLVFSEMFRDSSCARLDRIVKRSSPEDAIVSTPSFSNRMPMPLSFSSREYWRQSAVFLANRLMDFVITRSTFLAHGVAYPPDVSPGEGDAPKPCTAVLTEDAVHVRIVLFREGWQVGCMRLGIMLCFPSILRDISIGNDPPTIPFFAYVAILRKQAPCAKKVKHVRGSDPNVLPHVYHPPKKEDTSTRPISPVILYAPGYYTISTAGEPAEHIFVMQFSHRRVP